VNLDRAARARRGAAAKTWHRFSSLHAACMHHAPCFCPVCCRGQGRTNATLKHLMAMQHQPTIHGASLTQAHANPLTTCQHAGYSHTKTKQPSSPTLQPRRQPGRHHAHNARGGAAPPAQRSTTCLNPHAMKALLDKPAAKPHYALRTAACCQSAHHQGSQAPLLLHPIPTTSCSCATSKPFPHCTLAPSCTTLLRVDALQQEVLQLLLC
jgi:hypothetical protein